MILLAAVIFLLLGFAAGAAVMWFYLQPKMAKPQSAGEAFGEITNHVLTLAREKLGEHTTLATEQLHGKQQLISTNLDDLKKQLGENLGKISARIETLEKDRATQYATLGQQLAQTAEQLTTLRTATGTLANALSNNQVRGQWGECIAEDILTYAGLKENVSYFRQVQLKGEDGSKPRPDFTFPLPGGHVLHMDVKFPTEGYFLYQSSANETERETQKSTFLRAARARVKEAHQRNYTGSTTVDNKTSLPYLLVFIPNEQIYAFLFENDGDLLRDAIRQNIILCSPTTLLAVLAVVRQAEQTFLLQSQTSDLKKHLDAFHKQWQNFIEAHDDVAKAFDAVSKKFTSLLGTRTNMLERAFDKLLPTGDEATSTTLIGTVTQDDKTLN
jgi:DNA recombination protein RmuC